jgi:methylenetetrahydrofolate dehydrogenase (NADP+)/methenyltetrahydrofolate cyclohydrolase
MTALIFDGRAFAKAKEEELQVRVQKLKDDGIVPTMVSIVIGDIDGSLKYQEMKKKAGARVGIEIDIKAFDVHISKDEIVKEIERLNEDPKIHGIMVQLPLPKSFTNDDRGQILSAIDPKKDVDGMRDVSGYEAPVVRAVIAALHAAKKLSVMSTLSKVAVVGAKGFEGRKIVEHVTSLKLLVTEFDKGDDLGNSHLFNADVVISCTGQSGLITGDMVKEGVIAIDVGAPSGDFDFESVSQKASFITPVPGGIGPMTIALLMENIVFAASK